MFRGSASAKIDGKGRLKIPTDFRRSLVERYGKDVFITSIDGESALVYPLSVWEEIEGRLSALPSTNRARQRYLERVSYFGHQATLDGQGRGLMPQRLRQTADMLGEVIVSGRLDHLVVWNRDRFEAKLELEPFTEEDFAVLAEAGI